MDSVYQQRQDDLQVSIAQLRMSQEASNLRQRKMVPHASLPQKTALQSSTETTNLGVSQEKSGLVNESFEPMGSFDSFEISEGAHSPIGYSELDTNEGSAPKKKPSLHNGAARFASDTGIEMDRLEGGFDEETSLTEPLLSDEDSNSSGNNNTKKKKKEQKDFSLDVSITPTEASWQVGLQVFFPYIIAGLGMVAAGIVLDIVQVL